MQKEGYNVAGLPLDSNLRQLIIVLRRARVVNCSDFLQSPNNGLMQLSLSER